MSLLSPLGPGPVSERLILKIGHSVLRKKCSDVSPKELKNPRFFKFLKDMVVTMRQAQGVGLAANQAGRNLSVAVMECKSNRRYPRRGDFDLAIYINPRILKRSKKMSSDWEGCLSIPGYRGLVPRSRSVTFEALEINGKRVRKTVRGFLSRVIQHEVDHLNGLFYLDRMPNLNQWMHLEEFNRRFHSAVIDNN